MIRTVWDIATTIILLNQGDIPKGSKLLQPVP